MYSCLGRLAIILVEGIPMSLHQQGRAEERQEKVLILYLEGT